MVICKTSRSSGVLFLVRAKGVLCIKSSLKVNVSNIICGGQGLSHSIVDRGEELLLMI